MHCVVKSWQICRWTCFPSFPWHLWEVQGCREQRIFSIRKFTVDEPLKNWKPAIICSFEETDAEVFIIHFAFISPHALISDNKRYSVTVGAIGPAVVGSYHFSLLAGMGQWENCLQPILFRSKSKKDRGNAHLVPLYMYKTNFIVIKHPLSFLFMPCLHSTQP